MLSASTSYFVYTHKSVYFSLERLLLNAAIPQDLHQILRAVAGVGGLEFVVVVEVGPLDFPRRHGAVDVVAKGRELERRIGVGIEAQQPLERIAGVPRILGNR